MKLTPALFGFGLVAAIVSAAAAQDARLARLDPATGAAVARVVDSTRAAGLPTEPLIDKALEGASKRARGDRIVTAVRGLAADLRAARRALGGRASAPEIVAGAGALRAGAAADALARLREERPNQSLMVPLAVLTNLVSRGVPADSASAAVLALAGRGARDSDFGDLQRQVERDIAAGAPPAAAVSVRARGGGPPNRGPGRAGPRGRPHDGGPPKPPRPDRGKKPKTPNRPPRP